MSFNSAPGRAKTLHAASSLSVFVDADPVAGWCREDDLRRDITHMHGGYGQSKWVAEQMLHAGERGLAVTIYRLGLLTVNTRTGAGPAHDWLTLALPGLTHREADPTQPPLEFDLTPVDYAARALGFLVLHADPGIYHIANPQPVTQTQIAALRSSKSASSNAAMLAASRTRLQGGLHRSLDLFKSSQVRFQLENTARALNGSGIEFPDVTPEYLHLCLRHAEMAATA